MDKTFKIVPTRRGIYFGIPLGLAYSGLLIYLLWLGHNLFFEIALFFSLRLSFYSLIDFCVIRQIMATEDGLYIKLAFIKIEINPKCCFTVIQRIFLPEKYGSKNYALKLIRNEKQWWNRVFKNKVKLYIEDGYIDLMKTGKMLEEKFGIHFREIDMSWEGKAYTDDLTVLMKNKGRIP
jgi:hypothetical protein